MERSRNKRSFYPGTFRYVLYHSLHISLKPFIMTNLEITVHVNLGVTPELTALINAILHKETQPVVAASLEPAPEAAPAPAEEKPARKPRKSKSDTAAPEPAPASEAEAAPEPAPAEDEKPKELTEEDVRAAMHRTRTRIEGEDYKENTDGEKYQKYHRQLTANFKNISALLGADKPSALPADKRESFIKQCDELVIGDDGTITTKCPY